MEYTVDLTGITDREELHDRLASGLDFPEWYGRNLDALNDMFGAMEGRIEVYGYDDALKALPTYVQGFRMVCLDAMAENPELIIDLMEGPAHPEGWPAEEHSEEDNPEEVGLPED